MDTLQKLQTPKIKYKADILFVLDRSGSMTPWIDAVKEHIKEFIDTINITVGKGSPNVGQSDMRFGLLAYDCEDFYELGFTKDINKFKDVLNSLNTGGDEPTLVALDYALGFKWGKERHRITILITDEPLLSGCEVYKQIEGLERLKQKIKDSKALIYFKAPHYCKYYQEIGKLTEVLFDPLTKDEELLEGKFEKGEEVLKKIAKTVSVSSMNLPTPSGISRLKYVYNLKDFGIKVHKV